MSTWTRSGWTRSARTRSASTRSTWTRREVLLSLPERAVKQTFWRRIAQRFLPGGTDRAIFRGVSANPFAALEVQLALGRVEALITALLRDEGRFARGHHLISARMAYDSLLRQACELADVGPELIAEMDDDPDPMVRRMRAEIELRSRGWSW